MIHATGAIGNGGEVDATNAFGNCEGARDWHPQRPRKLAPEAATKLALAGANGEGLAIRRQEQERVPEAGRPRRRRSRCQFCDRLECQFDDRPSASRRCACDRGQASTTYATQAALPPALPRARRLGTGVRGLLRQFEHRADGDAEGAGRDERRLDAVIAVLVTAQKLLPPRPPSMCRSHSRSSHSGF